MKAPITLAVSLATLTMLSACGDELIDDVQDDALIEPDVDAPLDLELGVEAPPAQHVPVAECANVPPWHENYCTIGCPCSPLEGDCDSDLQCGAGLDCNDNVGASFGVSASIDVCQAPCMAAPNGLRAWWPGDTSASDYAGTNHGSLNGGVSAGATGFAHGAFSLNGSGYVQVADNAALDFDTGDLSLALWVKTTDTNGVKVLVDKRKEIANDVQGYVLYLYNGVVGFQLADGTGSSICSSSPAASCTNYDGSEFVANGKWHFVVVSVDRNNSSGLRFYVDGALVKTSNPTYRPGSLSNNRALRIGARSENGSGKLIGSVDEVQLYNRILTAWEVESLYETGTNGLCRNNPPPNPPSPPNPRPLPEPCEICEPGEICMECFQ